MEKTFYEIYTEEFEVKSKKSKLVKDVRSVEEKEEAVLKQAIKEAGYNNAYVEYEDKTVNILVSKKDASKSDAVTIIKLAYEKLGNSYIPSVSFKA